MNFWDDITNLFGRPSGQVEKLNYGGRSPSPGRGAEAGDRIRGYQHGGGSRGTSTSIFDQSFPPAVARYTQPGDIGPMFNPAHVIVAPPATAPAPAPVAPTATDPGMSDYQAYLNRLNDIANQVRGDASANTLSGKAVSDMLAPYALARTHGMQAAQNANANIDTARAQALKDIMTSGATTAGRVNDVNAQTQASTKAQTDAANAIVTKAQADAAASGVALTPEHLAMLQQAAAHTAELGAASSARASQYAQAAPGDTQAALNSSSASALGAHQNVSLQTQALMDQIAGKESSTNAQISQHNQQYTGAGLDTAIRKAQASTVDEWNKTHGLTSYGTADPLSKLNKADTSKMSGTDFLSRIRAEMDQGPGGPSVTGKAFDALSLRPGDKAGTYAAPLSPLAVSQQINNSTGNDPRNPHAIAVDENGKAWKADDFKKGGAAHAKGAKVYHIDASVLHNWNDLRGSKTGLTANDMAQLGKQHNYGIPFTA